MKYLILLLLLGCNERDPRRYCTLSNTQIFKVSIGKTDSCFIYMSNGNVPVSCEVYTACVMETKRAIQ